MLCGSPKCKWEIGGINMAVVFTKDQDVLS